MNCIADWCQPSNTSDKLKWRGETMNIAGSKLGFNYKSGWGGKTLQGKNGEVRYPTYKTRFWWKPPRATEETLTDSILSLFHYWLSTSVRHTKMAIQSSDSWLMESCLFWVSGFFLFTYFSWYRHLCYSTQRSNLKSHERWDCRVLLSHLITVGNTLRTWRHCMSVFNLEVLYTQSEAH